MPQKFQVGSRVRLPANPAEGIEEEVGVVEAWEGPKYPDAYIVRVDEKVEPFDDRLREVMEDQMEAL